VSDVYAMLEQQVFRCAFCSGQLHKGFTLDHLMPTIAGGRHEPANVVLVCGVCNASKQHKPLLEWLNSKGYALKAYVKEKYEWQRTKAKLAPA